MRKRVRLSFDLNNPEQAKAYEYIRSMNPRKVGRLITSKILESSLEDTLRTLISEELRKALAGNTVPTRREEPVKAEETSVNDLPQDLLSFMDI